MALERQFLRGISLVRDKVPGFDRFPFSLPAIRALDELDVHPAVTFLVGENGSGKSTLIEAIRPIPYTETEHYQITRDFLKDHERSLRRLLGDQPPSRDR